MLHLQPVPAAEPKGAAYAEAVARLATVRHALRLVEPFGAGPASDFDEDDAIAEAWAEVGPAKQRHFDRRSNALVGATAAGLEALLVQQQADREPHEEATQTLVDAIRRELADVAKIILD
jgi:hypothetical protein